MINSQNGVVHMKGTFNTAIINVLWQIVASKRFDPDAQDTLEMMDMLNRQFTSGNDSNIRTLFPIFLGRFFPLDDFDTCLVAMKKLMKQPPILFTNFWQFLHAFSGLSSHHDPQKTSPNPLRYCGKGPYNVGSTQGPIQKYF